MQRAQGPIARLIHIYIGGDPRINTVILLIFFIGSVGPELPRYRGSNLIESLVFSMSHQS
jgi:hypothetical protein